MVKGLMRCAAGCEWHTGDQGAAVTICRVGQAELWRESSITALSDWEVRRSRLKKAEESREAREQLSPAEYKRELRKSFNQLPESTKAAMRAYAVRKAREQIGRDVKARYASQESK